MKFIPNFRNKLSSLVTSASSKIITAALLATSLAVAPLTANAQTVQPAQQQSLQQTIDGLLQDGRLNGASVGVLVKDAKTGETLYSKNPSSLLVPGSNTKIYSSSAAIDTLGLNHTFSTTVQSPAAKKGSILNGNIYLKGNGDPTTGPAEYDALAASVAAKGIKRVTGQVIADDTHFDDVRLGSGWSVDDSPFSYQPEISALTVSANSNYDIGSITVNVTPSTAGKPATLSTTPVSNYVSFQNLTTTGAVGSENTISVERKLSTNTIVVRGSIPAGSAPYSTLSTVSDPTGYAASLFTTALAKHGVKVTNTQIGRAATPASSAVFASRTSPTLGQILKPYLKLSNNGIAEIFTKEMGTVSSGQQGTWQNGLSREMTSLTKFGMDTSKFRFVDGSGLSYVNLTSPDQTTKLLTNLQSQPWFTTWYDSLPVAGNPAPLVGGTLASRMLNTPAANNLRAKTGTLGTASAMSGYVTTADGQKLVFSIMENNFLGSSPKPIEDAIGVALASYGRSSGVQDQSSVQTQMKRQVKVDPNARD